MFGLPTIDLVAAAKFFAKLFYYLGYMAYIAGLGVTLGNLAISLWTVVTNSVHSLDSYLSSGTGTGGGEVMSCLYYFLHALGVDQAIGSFLVAATGLLLLWSGAQIHLFIYGLTNYVRESVFRVIN